jgi:alpha-beta hydrolase superfamily lysophospholipase
MIEMVNVDVNCERVTLEMSDGYDICIMAWKGNIGANALVISHGMKEYALRYDEVARFFALKGFAVFAYDHRGHGVEAKGRGELGFLAEKNGFCRVVEDLCEVVRYVKGRCPSGTLALLGHSFGSFVVQGYIERYGSEIDVCLLSGSADPRPISVGAGKCLAWMLKRVCGKRSRLAFMEWAVFGNYNRRIESPKSKNSWLCSDEDVVARYDSDELCAFVPTVGFFYDMFCGMTMVHEVEKMKNIPKDLPVFLFSGTEDPVGRYGSSLRELYDCYREVGIENVELKLYEGGRHEMLNEKCKFDVCEDMLKFIAGRV